MDDLAVPGTIYQIGVAPHRIDVLTSISALTFDEAWKNRLTATFGSGTYPVLSRNDLMTNKAAVGRLQDLIDLDLLRRFSKP